MAVLRDLLRYAAQLPTLFRDISMNHLPGLLTSLLGLRPEVRPLPAPCPQPEQCSPSSRLECREQVGEGGEVGPRPVWRGMVSLWGPGGVGLCASA